MEISLRKGPLNSKMQLSNRCYLFGTKLWFTEDEETKSCFMSNLLYVIAIVFLIGWVLGFFVYSVGAVIHVLLVVAIVAILLRLIRGDRL